MTGPMDDDGVVDLLRAAGHGGPDPSPTDVRRAMAAGTRIRRRRQASQVLGSGLAIAVVLGVGVATVAAIDGDNRGTPVTSSPDENVQPATSTAVLAARYLAEDLGEGWIAEGGRANLDPQSRLASRLPDADYTAHATAEAVDEAAFDAVCGEKRGQKACKQVDPASADAPPIFLWDWADRDPRTSELRGEASAYSKRISETQYLVVTVSVFGKDVSASEHTSHVDGVTAWFATVEEGLRKAVTDSRIAGAFSFGERAAAGVLAREPNLQLLAAALGPDFRMNPKGQSAGDSTDPAQGLTYPIVEVVPGSPTAGRVPSGYKLTASGGVSTRDQSPDARCKPMVEKGTYRSACNPVATDDGQRVFVQEFRVELGEVTSGSGKVRDAAGTTAYFQRTDGSLVEASLNIVSQAAARVTQASHDEAAKLLGDLRDGLVSFVADPKVAPAPGPATGEPVTNPGQLTADEQNQAYLQEALGSPTWGLFDGQVVLENNKGRYNELPSDNFRGEASLQRLTQAQFDAACGSKPGFPGCTEKKLNDGATVYTMRWADRDAATDELRGEGSAYYIRPDGTVVVATITLTATRVTAQNRDEQVNGTVAWLESYEDALIAAVTDPRMEFPAGE